MKVIVGCQLSMVSWKGLRTAQGFIRSS